MNFELEVGVDRLIHETVASFFDKVDDDDKQMLVRRLLLHIRNLKRPPRR